MDDREEHIAELRRILEAQWDIRAQLLDMLEALGFDRVELVAATDAL